jgi:hypothetical protein
MPVIKSIIKITLRPGTSSMRYQQMSMGAGNACDAEIHTGTMVIGNANILPGIALRNALGIGIAPINVPTNGTKKAPECSEIAPGKPGAISEHSGEFFVPFIGTFIGVIPIPRAFLKANPGKIFAFPMSASQGNADAVAIGDTRDLPDMITSIDMGAIWEGLNCREPYALTGGTVSFTGGHDSWTFNLGVDTTGHPSMTVEHERSSPGPSATGVGGPFGGNGHDDGGAPPASAAGLSGDGDSAGSADGDIINHG